MYTVHRPKLICGQGKLRRFIEKRLKTDYYYPTCWAPGGHLQTILRAVFQILPPIHYTREILPTPDGGEIALDWIDDDRDTYRGLVVILPGLTGGSQSSYSQYLGYQAKLFGCRAVIYNNRGCGNSLLKTPKFACAAHTDDLHIVLQFMKKKYPDLPFIVAGVSLGGIILSNYLANEDIKEKYVDIGFAASIAWDFHKSQASLETPFNRITYNRYLGKNLVKLAENNYEMFHKNRDQLPFNLDDVPNCTTIAEFDACVTVPLFGYKHISDYYSDASFAFKTHRVKTPIVFINAPNDPFSPENAIPVDDIAKNSNLALILTKTGGHIGFMEGLFPVGSTYMDRLFGQFLEAYLDHSSDLKD
ncbi:uncharacterized protein TRIADDRAFT_58949 [Trichoplax adhaerens]|uniref:AB hydrolase-1 domain-containing protein n=1 Tax=Trichoplax adhaerens TaxID=10228 RepID=B3S445_TRIAD|nr:hypothetical protein TRIADDRAFT_58949 [Trichoplax adhaerens]EDV22575.1 hypothetical protein TRIADDRAFT_58949 [Trichoplax adhaerens]|eukprot:XP_002115119.1 hypothetical protein TRIADDRAFT_58949 [Trichoplax adhaerens]